MEVKIFQATLTIDEKTAKLTKRIAKQFLIERPMDRWDRAMSYQILAEPICKVVGSTLGKASYWLYLVKDDVAGLKWVTPVYPDEEMRQRLEERGIHVDTPADVPTVIL